MSCHLLIHNSSIHCVAEDSEAMAVMASLREKVSEKTAEIDNLHQKMSTLAKEHEADVSSCA